MPLLLAHPLKSSNIVNKKKITLIASIVFTIALLAVLFYFTSPAKIYNAIQKVGWQFVFIGFGFHATAYLFRTFVLWLFFKDDDIGYFKLLKIHFVHNFYVHVIPASLGELSFPLLLKDKVAMSKSLSVLIISRLFIMGLTVLLFLVSVYVVFDLSSFFTLKFKNSYYIIVCATLFFAFLFITRKKIFALASKISIMKKIIGKLKKLFAEIKENGQKLTQPAFILKVTAASLVSIFLIAGYYITILKGLNMDYDIYQILFVSSIGMAFIILPIKSVGGFGTTEGSWAIGLILLGTTETEAIGAGFVIHIFALLNVLVLFLLGINYKKAFQKNQINSSKVEQKT